MSGNDDDRERPPADDRTGEQPPADRGQQRPQGRQGYQGQQGQRPQGQRPQGRRGQQQPRAQQPRQGGRQPPQGGGPPAQGRPPSARPGSGGGMLSDGVGRQILLVVAAFAVAGLAFGLLPALYGGQGDTPVQVGQQTDTPTPSPEQQDIQQKQFKNQVVNFVVFVGPYLTVGLGAIAGLAVGTKLTGGRQELLAVAAGGAGVGAALFVLFSGFLATQQAAVFEESFRFSEQVSYQFGTGLMNGVFVGIPTAIAAAGAAYAGDELGE